MRPAPVQAYLTEHTAAVSDGRRWTHQATFWLFHDAGADLNVILPSGAEVLAITLDGESKTPLQPAPTRLWLPLPGGRGGRVVRLAWAFPADRQRTSLVPPFLEGPRLEDVADGPIVWTIHVPAGYDVAEGRLARGNRVWSTPAVRPPWIFGGRRLSCGCCAARRAYARRLRTRPPAAGADGPARVRARCAPGRLPSWECPRPRSAPGTSGPEPVRLAPGDARSVCEPAPRSSPDGTH